MKISKQAHCIKLENGINAIFNNLLMDVIYVDDIEKEAIYNQTICNSEIIDTLLQKGIYVRDGSADFDALTKLNHIYDHTIGKIHIMYLILTNTCNLACRYCFLENNPNYRSTRMTMSHDIAIIAIEEFCTYLEKNNIDDGLIVFYGGEPLLNYQIIRTVVEYAKKRSVKIKYSIITNGTLINPEIADYFKENHVNIGLSIDGIKEIHDKNRPFKSTGEGSFDSSEEARKLLRDNDNEYGLSMTVSDEFLEQQDNILYWLKENNERGIFYNLYHYSKIDANWKNKINQTTDFIIKSYEYFEDGITTDGRIQRQIDSVINNQFLFSDCGAIGCGQFVIMPDGDITICHGDSNTGRHIVGNISSIRLEEIFSTEEGKQWLDKSPIKRQQCLECEALFCCGGGCRLQAENLFGSREEIDYSHCIYVKKVLKWILNKCYK